MPRLTNLKKMLLPGVFAAAVAAGMGFHSTSVSAAAPSDTWSIVAHFQYDSGFEFDYVVERGVSTRDMPSFLAECGASHWIGGDVVRYYCYPTPE